jgi:hypothetical membrane protein
MPTQILYELMNYGSIVLVVAAIVVGMVMTRGAVRKLLGAALVVTILRFVLSGVFPGWIDVTSEVAAFAYGVVQWLLTVAEPLLLVTATIVGAHTIKVKNAALAALVDTPKDTWAQPETSPDPRLVAD